MREYYMLTESLQLLACLEFINQHQLQHSLHLNRVRFTVAADSQLETLMLLRLGPDCFVCK